jgi:putative hydrolase of the HAD superfamily
MIKAIIYDADGMVITPPMMFSEYLGSLQKIPTDSVIYFFTHEFKQCLLGQLDLKVALEPYVSKWNWDKGVEALIKLWHEYENCPNQEVLASVMKLRKRGVICVLATNQDIYRTQYMDSEMGINKYFDMVFVSCELGLLKPEAEFLEKVYRDLQTMGVKDKNEVQYWDDREKYVGQAKLFGFQGHIYSSIENYLNNVSTSTDNRA